MQNVWVHPISMINGTPVQLCATVDKGLALTRKTIVGFEHREKRQSNSGKE